MIRSEDEYNYDAYVLIYVDDVMVIRRGSDNVLRRIDNYFNLNPSSIGDPDIYLGGELNKMRLESGVWTWENIPARYVKESVSNVEKYLVELDNARCPLPKKKTEDPFVGDYES